MEQKDNLDIIAFYKNKKTNECTNQNRAAMMT